MAMVNICRDLLRHLLQEVSQRVSQTTVAKRVADIAYGHFLHSLLGQLLSFRSCLIEVLPHEISDVDRCSRH